MSRLIEDIGAFLETNGFEYSFQSRNGFDVICARTLDGRYTRVILPLEISVGTLEEAVVTSQKTYETVQSIKALEGHPIIIPEDRWNRQREMMEARLLAHLEIFNQAYARNCEVRKIDKETAGEFLERHHSYGDAACRFRYGLFLKRYTGHTAQKKTSSDCNEGNVQDGSNARVNGIPETGSLIAVATFSNARKWIKEGKEIRSYEWTRYASLPALRVSGGMGKLLNAFINEVQPDDIMSYADLEWSEGEVYKALGFAEEAPKDPVGFGIDPYSWTRRALRGFTIKPGVTGEERTDGKPEAAIAGLTDNLFYVNFGSRKFRLKLTDYQ